MATVIFSHGKESGPWGTKIKRLANTARRLGFTVESIDYTDTMDPEKRSQRLIDSLSGANLAETLLVGSSMGGYVTLQAARECSVGGIFLLAPAVYLPGYEQSAPVQRLENLELVHGWQDDIIPVEHSVRFAHEQRGILHLVEDDHRLINTLDRIDYWFIDFLQRFRQCEPTAS